jgi:SAM-dependent methyltransferase/ribosomal protein S27E
MKEEEIRKRDVFNKYLELVEKDVKVFFDFNSFIEINCPACDSNDFLFEFEKLGFKYVSCKTCSSLFVNPRPPFEVLNELYSKSPSTSFWVNEFFKPVAEVRREKIFRPRAEYISKLYDGNARWVIGDIGAGFGLFLEELRKILPENIYIAIEPSVEMAGICSSKKLDMKCMCLEDIKGLEESFNLLTAFELLEHLYEPLNFLKKTYSLLKTGGYLFLTTLNGKGFDILLLWEKSKSIAPPHHLNFFNTESLKFIMEKIGFEVIEVSTPGKLDWDIVEGMIKNEGINLGRFWNLLVEGGSEKCKDELQNWISENKLSSHMRILVRKPSSLTNQE